MGVPAQLDEEDIGYAGGVGERRDEHRNNDEFISVDGADEGACEVQLLMGAVGTARWPNVLAREIERLGKDIWCGTSSRGGGTLTARLFYNQICRM